MSKATRRAEQVRRMQAEAARRERTRKTMMFTVAVVTVVIVIAALVATKLIAGGGGSGPAAGTPHASSRLVEQVSNVPASTFNAIGAGDVNTAPVPISGPPATVNGKARFLYMGAEYCPYCAAERWAVAVALARFGSWSKLGETASSGTDVFPHTATLTFRNATYSSRYVSFTGVELQDAQGKPLQRPAPADGRTFTKYDGPPYFNSRGGIPFLDIGGSYVSSGASYDPGVLAGKTHEQIASALSNPRSPIARAVDGTANVLTAAVCQATHGEPGSVCMSTGVHTAAAQLGTGG